MNYHIISIEGNIGSGKTTLMHKLKEYYASNNEVVFLKEPVDEWEKIVDENGVTMLQKFYSDQYKYSFSFQMMAYISRLKILRDTIKEFEQDKSKNYVIITERSLFTDKLVFARMLFDDNKIEYINYQIYLSWFNTFASDYPVNKIIYVCADPEICYDRIGKRSRTGEDQIPLEYLKNCHKYHTSMLDMNSIDRVSESQIVLNGNIDIYENPKQIDKWISTINKYIYNKEILK